jgi:hypothetical protein
MKYTDMRSALNFAILNINLSGKNYCKITFDKDQNVILPGWSGKPRGSARGLSDIFTK